MIRTTNAQFLARPGRDRRTTGALAAVGLATALAVSGGSAGPASASATTAATVTGTTVTQTTPQATSGHPRMAAVCARIPRLITRTENLQARLNGDENTRGSVTRLARRIERAEQRGNADLADYLANRLEIREQRAAILPEQLELLHRAEATCDEVGS